MRDPARIDPVLAGIRQAWVQSPDLRLCQLIVNLVRPSEPCPRVFSFEDSALMERLKDWLSERSPIIVNAAPEDA